MARILKVMVIPTDCPIRRDARMIDFSISLLLNLEAAQKSRSMLFSDEQKLLFKGGKKGFVENTKLDFMRC